jgi:hypothetical protein
MIATTARRVETRQSDSLAAASEFIGFHLTALDQHMLFYGNPDMRRNFEVLDMNPVGKQIWFVGHPANLNHE